MDTVHSVSDVPDSISISSNAKILWKWSPIHPNKHPDPSFVAYGWTSEEKESAIQDNDNSRDDMTIQKYTMDEYDQVSRDDNQDTSWSKIETDYFLELAKDCQLNFIVMADRYQFGIPGTETSKNRTVPELRARYNQLCKKIPRYQHLYDPNYSKDVDEARREWISHVSNDRNKESIQNEQRCLHYIENFIKNDYANLLIQRDQIMNIFSGDVLAFIDGISQTTTCLNTTMKPTPAAVTHSTSKKPQKKSTQPSEPRSIITSPISSKKSNIGPILRSAKIKPVRTGLTKHVEKISLELEIPMKPCIPTASICTKYEEIRSMIVKLIDTKKSIEKLENELRFIRTGAENKKRSADQIDSVMEIASGGDRQGDDTADDTTPTKKQKSV